MRGEGLNHYNYFHYNIHFVAFLLPKQNLKLSIFFKNLLCSIYLYLLIIAIIFEELMTFDANHLIRMAEQRGLFGKHVKGRKQKIPSPIIMSLTNSDEPR